MKPKNRTPRRRAREFAVQALYQAALNQLPDTEVAKNIRENEYFAKADNELFTAIFFGVQAKRPQPHRMRRTAGRRLRAAQYAGNALPRDHQRSD